MNDRTEHTPLPAPAERVAALVAGRLDNPDFVVGVFIAYVELLDDPGMHDTARELLRELARLVQGGGR